MSQSEARDEQTRKMIMFGMAQRKKAEQLGIVAESTDDLDGLIYGLWILDRTQREVADELGLSLHRVRKALPKRAKPPLKLHTGEPDRAARQIRSEVGDVFADALCVALMGELTPGRVRELVDGYTLKELIELLDMLLRRRRDMELVA